MIKLLKSLWARLLFRDRGIVPTRRFLIVFGLFAVVMTLFAATDRLSLAWIVGMIALFIVFSLFDLLQSPRRQDIVLRRDLPRELERGLRYAIPLHITNNGHTSCCLVLKDDVPQSCVTDLPVEAVVAQQASKEITYHITAPVRGSYHMESVFVRFSSLLGLWQKQMLVPLENTFKVIPDLTETRHFLENAQKFLLHDGSKIRKQLKGEGEFAQIRSYVVGDDPRKINWRQTAKLHDVMTNEYEPEHGKYVTILIDCGRMMGSELTEGNRLEKALEAAMTVTAAALKNDDYVSVLAFGKRVRLYVPPAKGMAHMQTILHSIYDLEVEAGEANYAQAMSYLQTVQKKRSLMMLFSDVHTFLHEESALVYLQRLRRRHLFMMIGIEDEELHEQAQLKSDSVETAMMKAMAQQQIQIKKYRKTKWERSGLIMIEAKEERLATAAVSNYIRIMNQGVL
ncbi:DUF58 domain-containing protein [Lentibacillus saliphilus]|uniref:DUF58 domain-containing protein n=1 Tax=Lentibacillus saliphilus TaxID=2737028 RepID=UPI001C2F4D3E|nr:DUF58 domain-containing protein [Lentibacillus saliphilus]